MKVNLSNRLLACCGYVRPGDRVADIGCDHGYLGIHLLQSGVASSIIAADIHAQPLLCAARNARRYGVGEKLQTYLSDGVCGIPRDFDTLVCAGMGADTMIHILSQAPWLRDRRYQLILQCQSRRPELRRYLSQEGFRILRESLARDGKFIYTIMEVIYDPGTVLSPAACQLSPALLESGDPLLPEFYQRVLGGLRLSAQGLARTGGEKYEAFQAVIRELEAWGQKILEEKP